VREVIHNFNKDGFASLEPRYAGGRPPKSTLPERQALKKVALGRPADYGEPFSTWSLTKLADHLVRKGVVDDISHEGLRALLREEGVSFQALKTWKESNDPDVRTTVTSPPVRHAFRRLNGGKAYADQIKPFNFLLTAAGAKPPARHPAAQSFRLIAPYESDPAKWNKGKWIDVHHPEAVPYSITTRDGRPGLARVDTFADVLAKYESHPESKSLGPDGEPCGRGTIGLLQRRPVTVGAITLIGKESNRIEERSRGELTVEDADELVTTYENHDEWYRIVLPRLRLLGVSLAVAAGMSERRARDVLAARVLPHSTRRALVMNLDDAANNLRP
jgi:transposase